MAEIVASVLVLQLADVLEEISALSKKKSAKTAEIDTSVLDLQPAAVLKKSKGAFLAPLLRKVNMSRNVRDDVEHILNDFGRMLAVLKYADQRQSNDLPAKVWVMQVGEVAYEMGDIMDKLRYHLGRSIRGLHDIVTWYSIVNQIHRIRRRIRDISERSDQYALASKVDNHRIVSKFLEEFHLFGYDLRLNTYSAEESQLVGIYYANQELIKRCLYPDHSRLQVIAVVGMGGVGKTTLVRKIYEDYNLRRHFEYRFWITTSEPVETTKLLRSAFPFGHKISSMAQLADEAREFLRQKRYVVVIDDIWREGTWDIIKSVFPDNKNGSRIIVMTRSRNIAAYCAKTIDNVFQLDPLTEEDASTLFYKNVFPLEQTSFSQRKLEQTSKNTLNGLSPDLEQTSENILTKCGGVPLAIVAIGGLLSTKNKSLTEWERVNRHFGTELERLNVMKVLSYSYNDLPSHLKPCFLYFGIYPPLYEIKRAEISRQWVAEGFISSVPGSSPEDVSENNLKELAERSLIGKTKVDSSGRVESCQVNELIHEFILLKSKEQNLHKVLPMELQDETRRLAIYSGQSFEGDAYSYSQFQSLFLFGSQQKDPPSLAKFGSLKVLSLQGKSLYSFPHSIVDLIFLRYLSLRRTNIATIPHTIKKLQNLLTLDLKYTPVSKLPNEIIQLQCLRHLLVCDASGLGGAKLPVRLGNLRSMKTLLLLDVADGGYQLKQLGKLTQLRRLSVTSVKEEDGMALNKSLMKMVHLQSLAISSVDSKDMELSTPSIHLRSIKLTGRLRKLPQCLLQLPSLVKLELWHSQLYEEDPFQALQFSLRCLEDLRMFDEAYKGEKLDSSPGGFPSLKSLQIGNLKWLKFMTLERGTMPNLQFLAIRGCAELKRLPWGIEHLDSLKEIHLPSDLLANVMEKQFSKKENQELELKISEIKKEVLEEQADDWEKLQRIPVIRQNFCVDGTWYSTNLD